MPRDTVSATPETTASPAWLRRPIQLGIAVSVLLAVVVLWRSAVLAPYSDQFEWIGRWYRLQADHDWGFYLFAPHNLNRMVWTFALMAVDLIGLGGTNAPLIISGALCLGLMAWIAGREAHRAAEPPLGLAVAFAAVVVTLMGGNVLDAALPICVTYLHSASFAMLAIVLAEGASGRGVSVRRAAALFCAVASGFGSAGGLPLWPVMAWGALRRRDWSWLAAVLLVAAAFLAFYASGQKHMADANVLPALKDPYTAVILALGYLTLPWTRLALTVAWIAGGVIAIVAIVLILRKGGPQASRSERVASAFMLFTLGTAAMAGLGRTGLQDPYNIPIRYEPLVVPLQVGFLMLAAPWAGSLWRRHRRTVEPLIASGLVVLFALNLVMSAKVVRASDIIRNAIADFHAGHRTPEMRVLVHPDFERVDAFSAQMRRDGFFQHELHLKRAPQPS